MAETDQRKVLIATEFHMQGGGYHTIIEGVATRFAERGWETKILGTGYDAREHTYPFSVIPTQHEWLPAHITSTVPAFKPDWVILAMDIPKIGAIAKNIRDHEDQFFATHRVAGIFPVESDPVEALWAEQLGILAVRFTFTDFGVKCLEDAGVTINKVPVGVGEEWYEEAPVPEKLKIPYVLTVADNQIRKNLPDAMQAMSQVISRHPDVYYVLVTRPNSKDGWNLGALCPRVGLSDDRFILLDQREITRTRLRTLYRNAICMILPSLAEGIGLPLYEAQACGCPVLATDCTGAKEAVALGDLIKVSRKTIYPWGNVNWYWPDVDDLVEKIEKYVNNRSLAEPVQFPSWNAAADKMLLHLSLFEAMTRVEEKPKEEQDSPSAEADSADEEDGTGREDVLRAPEPVADFAA